MIIPIYLEHKFEVGDIIISLITIETKFYHITRYHEFIITDIDINQRFHIKDIETDLELSYYTLTDFKLKTDMKTAKNRYEYLKDKKLFLNFIHLNCKNKEEDYDDREIYDRCKLKKGYKCSCVPEEKCIKYISNDIINKNSFIVKYSRNMKLKNLNYLKDDK